MIIGRRLDTGEWLTASELPGAHVLVAGMTGWGKTNEVNYFLWQMADNPYKQFVLCNAAGKPDYVQWFPRAACVAVGKEATDKALDILINIMQERYHNLIGIGMDDEITDEVALRLARTTARSITPSPELPMIELVMDEFVEYMKGPGGANRLRKVHTLLTIGRAAGIRLILATQRPSDEQANTDIREQCSVRVGFAMDANGAVMVFGPAGKGLPVETIATKGQGFAIGDGMRMPIPFIAPECNEAVVFEKAIDTKVLRISLPGMDRYYDDNRT